MPSDLSQIKNKLTSIFPVPNYSEDEKKIFSFLKGVDVSKITNHMMLEWQINNQYQDLKDPY